MTYSHIIENCFESVIGSAGIKEGDFNSLLSKAKTAAENIYSKNLPLFSISENSKNIDLIKRVSQEIKDNFESLVILGTGGSTLGGQCLAGIKPDTDIPILFMDNVDQHSFDCMFKKIRPEKSGFLVISKSGTTMETLSQFGYCLKTLQEKNIKNYEKNFLIITEKKDSPLRKIGESLGIKILEHEEKIGGRFSAFTNVGLIPACVAGLDINALCKGALINLKSMEPVKGAALNIAMMEKNISSTVLMPYVDRLINFTKWHRQIWAESLGKNGKGTTPIDAIGTIDQHSQMQLYLDGPKDKMFTFIKLNKKSKGQKLQFPVENKELAYLNGKTLEDVMNTSCQATITTLIKNNLPVRIIEIDNMAEETLGGLMMHFISETVITAELLGINPFDQPAVEEGKILARALLKGGDK